MRTFATYLFTVALLAAAVGRADEAELNRLLGQCLAAYTRNGELTKEKNALSADLYAKANDFSGHASLLTGKEPYTAAEAEKQREAILNLERQITSYNESIRRTNVYLEKARQTLELGQIKDLEERRKRGEQYQQQAKELRDKANAAAKPISDKIAQHNAAHREPAKQFGEALTAFFRSPTAGKFAGAANTGVHGNMTNGFFGTAWQNAEKKQLVWAHLRVRDRSESLKLTKKLDGKFPISSTNANNIWLWAGNFQIAFIVDHPEWKNKETVVAAVKALVDLDGLAALTPTPAQ